MTRGPHEIYEIAPIRKLAERLIHRHPRVERFEDLPWTLRWLFVAGYYFQWWEDPDQTTLITPLFMVSRLHGARDPRWATPKTGWKWAFFPVPRKHGEVMWWLTGERLS